MSIFDYKHKCCFSHNPLQRSCWRLPSSINIEICPWPLRDQVMLLLTISITAPLLILNRRRNVFWAPLWSRQPPAPRQQWRLEGQWSNRPNYPHAYSSSGFSSRMSTSRRRSSVNCRLPQTSSAHIWPCGLTYLCSISIFVWLHSSDALPHRFSCPLVTKLNA